MSWFKRRANREPSGHPRIIYATRAAADAANARMVAAGIETEFRSHYQGESAYFVFRGNDAEKARKWLLDQSITERLQYYVVETPDGEWGKDIDGLYLEKLRPWQYDAAAAEHTGTITGTPQESAVNAAARGKTDNFVVEVTCGQCAYSWHDGLRYRNVTAVRCPGCQALNSVDSTRTGDGPPPYIQIAETHNRTEESSGPGVRSCHDCDTRWHSLLAELIDTGRLAELKARGECSVKASWESTIGLRCGECGRARCMAHLGEPDGTGDVPQAHDYHCPDCGAAMSYS